MKWFLMVVMATVGLILSASDADAGCRGRLGVVGACGVSAFQQQVFVPQQQVFIPQQQVFAQQQFFAAPQSVGFFAASQPAFVTRQFVSQPVAIVPTQSTTIRRGLFGNVRSVRTVNSAAVVAPAAFVAPATIVTRSRVFVR